MHMLTGYCCIFKIPAAVSLKDNLIKFAKSAFESRYSFFYIPTCFDHFYVVDTFHGDVQWVCLLTIVSIQLHRFRKLTLFCKSSVDSRRYRRDRFELYAIDDYTILALMHVDDRNCTLHLLHVDYANSSTTSLYKLDISCEGCLKR